jgi:hypothetical protein
MGKHANFTLYDKLARHAEPDPLDQDWPVDWQAADWERTEPVPRSVRLWDEDGRGR